MTDSLFVLDTHILLWTLLDKSKLYKKEVEIIKNAQQNNKLIISSISLWEIAMLASKNKIRIYSKTEDFLKEITEIKGLNIHQIDYRVAAESVSLLEEFHGDPADRIITATTKLLSACLITRDTKIINWSQKYQMKVN